MLPVLIHTSLLLLAFCSALYLALGMSQHFRKLEPKPITFLPTRFAITVLWYRILGCTLQLAVFILALKLWSVGTACVIWFGLLSLNTWLIALLMAYRPSALSAMAAPSLLLSFGCCAVSFLI